MTNCQMENQVVAMKMVVTTLNTMMIKKWAAVVAVVVRCASASCRRLANLSVLWTPRRRVCCNEGEDPLAREVDVALVCTFAKADSALAVATATVVAVFASALSSPQEKPRLPRPPLPSTAAPPHVR